MKKSLIEPPIKVGEPLLDAELSELYHLRERRDKFNIEFNRYKQDCRKRALDLAHLDYQQGKILMDSKVNEQADKYYKWLISIPND